MEMDLGILSLSFPLWSPEWDPRGAGVPGLHTVTSSLLGSGSTWEDVGDRGGSTPLCSPSYTYTYGAS